MQNNKLLKEVIEKISDEYRIGLHAAKLTRKRIVQLETDLAVHHASNYVNISHHDYEKMMSELSTAKADLEKIEIRNQAMHDARELVYDMIITSPKESSKIP